jgi:hypothetical protein
MVVISRQSSGVSRQCLLLAVFLLFMAGVAATAAERDGRWAILISGASGDPELEQIYLKEMTDLYSVLTDSLGFPRNQISVLFEDPSKNPGMIQRKSTRDELKSLCRDLATRVQKNDLVFVFIEGHGNYDGKAYKLNLVGNPDPTGEDLASMLYSIPAQRFIIVNATNCSGGSIPALSRKGTINISATKSGMEKNLTHAAQFFIDAFKNNTADSDKNGRVSIMEAFSYTKKKVEEYYQSEDHLPTEHTVLDDNGDGKAENQPSPENGEGLIAKTTFLDAGVPVLNRAGLTPEQQKLAAEAQSIVTQIEALKYAKSGMPEADYEKKLEELLVKLAQINAKLPK